MLAYAEKAVLVVRGSVCVPPPPSPAPFGSGAALEVVELLLLPAQLVLDTVEPLVALERTYPRSAA